MYHMLPSVRTDVTRPRSAAGFSSSPDLSEATLSFINEGQVPRCQRGLLYGRF